MAMKPTLTVSLVVLIVMSATLAYSQAPGKPRRIPDGHPDLSGTWAYGVDLPPIGLTKRVDGKVIRSSVDQSARHTVADVPGALPWTKTPSYKPEFREKVKYLEANESKLDPVFYCAKPGVPRIGSPRKIVQLPKEMIFLYEDISGDPYRVIPTDGRAHRPYPNPSAYGDSIGRWDGDVFGVDVNGFSDDTWFGEDGYFHTDAMHVVERIWKDGDNLVWQATVEDPNVLAKPRVMPARLLQPSSEP